MSFAIEITEENKGLILDRLQQFTDIPNKPLDIFLSSKEIWYFVTYYKTDNGKLVEWTFLPVSFFERRFDFDAEQIKTDMTLIVRK